MSEDELRQLAIGVWPDSLKEGLQERAIACLAHVDKTHRMYQKASA